jgi:hypothetical protein
MRRPCVVPSRFVILSAARDLLVCFLVVAPAVAEAQKPVLLQLRPRIGDTIYMRLEQQTELGSRRTDMKGQVVAAQTALTFSRAIVESGVATSTTVLAITDSVFVTNGQSPVSKSAAPLTRQVAGQRVRLQIAPDGSLALPSESQQRTATRAPSLIPATFPTTPVAVGEKWMREAPLPAGSSQLGATIVGWVKATFRLDSLTRDGELAWISIDGKLTPDPAGAKLDAVTVVDDGSVEGYMVLDRARGWLTESKFTIVAHSTMKQPFGIAGQPVRFEIRLIQSLTTVR